MERDITIINTITKFRFLLSRQIRCLCGFTGQRACDYRLHKLIEVGYIERRKILYGIPSLYFVTKKSKRMLSLPFITYGVRVEQILHDVLVIDTAIYLMNHMTGIETFTDRELKHAFGFGSKKHTPDLSFTYNGKKYAVEIELSVKQKSRLEGIIKDNFKNFDEQLWFLDKSKMKLVQNMEEMKKMFPVKTYDIKGVVDYVKTL